MSAPRMTGLEITLVNQIGGAAEFDRSRPGAVVRDAIGGAAVVKGGPDNRATLRDTIDGAAEFEGGPWPL